MQTNSKTHRHRKGHPEGEINRVKYREADTDKDLEEDKEIHREMVKKGQI